MTRTMICGIVILIVINTFFTGCFSDDDDGDEEDGFDFDNIIVSDPVLNNRDGDQLFIGGYTNEGEEFFHIFIEHRDAPLFGDEDFIYSFNNVTGDTTLLFSDYEIRSWAMKDKHLIAYNVHPTTPGPGSATYDHEITHIDLETGQEEHFRRHLLTGRYMLDDEFIIVGSAGSYYDEDPDGYAVVYFGFPDYGDGSSQDPEWIFTWQHSDSDIPWYLEVDVRIDEVFSGDAIRKNLSGFINPINDTFSLFRCEKSWDFEKVLEVGNAIDFNLYNDQIAVIVDSEVYTATWNNLNNNTTAENVNNFTKIKGTQGARQVDIYEDFLLIQKSDGLFLFHTNGESVKIYDGLLSDVWLEENDGTVLRACGTFPGNGDDSGHIDLDL